MSYSNTQGKTLTQPQNRHSDSPELIPAEVQATIRHNDDPLVDSPFAIGYTSDDEGLINNFALETGMYPSEYSSPRQQWQ